MADAPLTYPPLPEPSAKGMGDEYAAFDRNGRPMGKAYEELRYFNGEQMRAYVDADRAARAAQPQPQPAQPLTDDQMEMFLSRLDSVARCYDSYEYGLPLTSDWAHEEMLSIVRETLAHITAPSTPTPPEDAP